MTEIEITREAPHPAERFLITGRFGNFLTVTGNDPERVVESTPEEERP